MIKVTVKGRRATAVSDEPITTGSVGIPVRFSFDDAWDGLGKVAVFRNPLGEALPDMMIVDGECTVPPEALLLPNEMLLIGIYGTDGENVVIPTIYAVAGMVLAGAAPSEIESEDWTPSLAEQVLAAAERAVETANSVRADANAGAFDGPPGPPGEPGEKGDKGNKGDLGTYIIPATYANDTLTCTATYAEVAAAILNGQVPVLRVTISDGDGQVLDLVHSWQRPRGLLPEIHFAGEDEEGQKVDAWVSPSAGWSLDKQPLVSWGEIHGDLNDQTDLQNALDAKYDFQEDGIPAEDLDADVQETLGKVYSKAGLLRDTASGDIVSIVPDATVPKLLGLTAAINPVQDLHGYDHPWPGGGGKNLCGPISAINGTYSDGVWTTPALGSYNLSRLTFSPVSMAAASYTLSFKARMLSGSGTIHLVNLQTANNTTPATSTRTEIAKPTLTSEFQTYILRFDYSAETEIERLVIQSSSSSSALVIEVAEIQLELGSTATSWEPYENLCPITGWTGETIHVSPSTTGGTTYPVTFPTAGPVYGGTRDVVNGVLTVTRVAIDLGAISWTHSSNYPNLFFGYVAGKKAGLGNFLCSAYAVHAVGYQSLEDFEIGGAASNTGINIMDSRFASSDAATFKAAVTGQTIVFELATPITYTLTPQDIATILGQNNVWADTGDVTVEYAADLKTYIDSKIAAAVAALS